MQGLIKDKPLYYTTIRKISIKSKSGHKWQTSSYVSIIWLFHSMILYIDCLIYDDQGIPVLKPIMVLNDKSSCHLFFSLHERADRHAMKMNIARPLILYEYFFASTFTLYGTRWFSLQCLLSYHCGLFFSKCKSFWKGIINEEKYQTLASTHVSFLFFYTHELFVGNGNLVNVKSRT